MHIYPQDYNIHMLHQWIKNAIENGNYCIDIRFNSPDDMNDRDTNYTKHLDLVWNILGEISQTIMVHKQVDGSISFGGTTATVYITTS